MTLKDDARRVAWKRNYLKVLMGAMGVVTLGVVLGLVVMGMRDSEFVILSGLGDGFLLLMAFAALAGMERRGLRWAAYVGSGLAGILVVAVPAFMTVVWYVERSHSYGPRPGRGGGE